MISVWATNQLPEGVTSSDLSNNESLSNAITRAFRVDNTDAKLMGQLTIPVIALIHSKPVDQWFRLNGENIAEFHGEVHVKLHYTTTTVR